jgi:hypothetical protein
MKEFLDWLLARRHRVILLAAAMTPVMPVVTAALIALETLRSGVRDTLPGVAIGAGSVTALWLGVGRPLGVEDPFPAVHSALAIFSFAVGLGLGSLLGWARDLGRTFQSLLLICAACVLLLGLMGPGGGAVLAPVFDYIVALVSARGATDAEITAFRAAQPLMLGLLAAGLLTSLLVAVFLAYWMCGIAVGNTRFGKEFRALRLGRSLGIAGTVLITAGLVLAAPLVQNLAALALVAFVFQGLAVLHAWAHARRWHAAYVAPVYVLLITPLVGVVVLALSAVGLMDNWFDLRAPVRPRT